MVTINFWVRFSIGPVGLRLTGPSAKLLITLIIFKFILDACYLCLQVNAWNCNQINATIVFIYPYLAAKTSVLKYVLHWPYVLSGCVIGIYSFRSSESFFQLDNTKHNLILILALKPILGKILLDIDAKTWHTGFCLHFSDLQSFKCLIERGFTISAWMRQSSATSNTLWACIIFWGTNHCTKIFCFCVHSGALDLIYPGTSLYEHILWIRLEKKQNLQMQIVVIITNRYMRG